MALQALPFCVPSLNYEHCPVSTAKTTHVSFPHGAKVGAALFPHVELEYRTKYGLRVVGPANTSELGPVHCKDEKLIVLESCASMKRKGI